MDTGHHEGLRFERKFVVGEARGSQSSLAMRLRLHPALFSEIHAERWVNSVYFDTIDRRHYDESEAGLRDRTKIRVRWYGHAGPSMSSPFIEFKMKRNTLGRKLRFALGDATVADLLSRPHLHALLQRSASPPDVQATLTALRPSLMNRYRRRYYLSACHRFRITVDTDLEYRRPVGSGSLAIVSSMDRLHTVIELKYALEDDDGAREVARRLPFRVDRNSKYLSGLQRLGA